MKFILYILVSVFLLELNSCQKGYQSAGIIAGPDYRECATCGGYFIQIDSVIYNFDDLSINSSIDLKNELFPLKVKLDWMNKPYTPITKWITITRIAKN